MYYSFYMNERLALDNWETTNDCNWLLKKLLAKDRRKNLDEKIEYYKCHRHMKDQPEYFSSNEYKERLKEYENYLLFMEDWSEEGEFYVETCRNPYFDNFIKARDYDGFKLFQVMHREEHRATIMRSKLREIEEVKIYQADLDYIETARKNNHLTYKEHSCNSEIMPIE